MVSTPGLPVDQVYKLWQQVTDVFKEAPDARTHTAGSQN